MTLKADISTHHPISLVLMKQFLPLKIKIINNMCLKKLFLLSILMTVSIFSSYGTSVSVSGNVSGNWTADTVLVEGNLLVPFNEALIISPGTFIQFQSYYRIDVDGRIYAAGLASDTILFTIRDTSNFYAQSQGRGGWSGIRFRNTGQLQDSSVFEFCRFEFSKATDDSANSYGGAVLTHQFHKLRLSNCLFYNNYSFYSGGAVYLNNSNAVVENCCFRNNYSGNTGTVYGYGGGICSMYSSPVVKRNQFYANSSTGVGGAVSFDSSNPVFEMNVMRYNYSALGGALGILRSAPTATFSNNLISENEALFFGGGMCCIRSFPVLSNFTITGNEAAYAGGFYCNDSAAPSMYNSIICGNTGFGMSVYIWDIYSAPNFYYCDIEGDTSGFEGSGAHLGYHGEYFNNSNTDPMLSYSDYFPYQLLPGSPCIDSGTPDAGFLALPATDITGAPRIENSRIDIGTYEFGATTDDSFPNLPVNIESYPNPFSNTTTVKFAQILNEPGELIIYNAMGTEITKQLLIAGQSTYFWNGCNANGSKVSSGIYILQFNVAGKLNKAKIIKQ